jgi:hypothetical protein
MDVMAVGFTHRTSKSSHRCVAAVYLIGLMGLRQLLWNETHSLASLDRERKMTMAIFGSATAKECRRHLVDERFENLPLLSNFGMWDQLVAVR